MAQRIIIILLIAVVGLLAYGLVTNRQQTRLLEQLLSELKQPSPPPPEVAQEAVPPVVEEEQEPEAVASETEPEVDPIEPATGGMPPPVVETTEEPTVEEPAPPMVAADLSAAVDEWPRFSASVEQVLRELLDGEYAAVTGRFDANLSAALPEDRLTAVMEPLRRSRGGFVEIIEHTTPNVLLPQNLFAFRVVVRTQRGEPLVFTITLNERQQIAGLYVK